MEWEEVDEVGRSYILHLVRIRHSISTRQAVHEGVHEGAARKEEGAARLPSRRLSKASVLLRSVRKLRRECDEIENGGSVVCEEVLCVRKCRVYDSQRP
jgi:hypothetical protein